MDIIFALIAIYSESREKRAVSAYIFLSLLSSFWNTLSDCHWPFPHRMVDLAIILGITIVLIRSIRSKANNTPISSIHRLEILIAVNFFISALLAWHNGISLFDVYKATRFFFGSVLTFTVLAVLNAEELKMLLKYILITNAVICVLILFQFRTGIAILKYDMHGEINSSMGTYGLYPPLSLWLSFVLLISAYGSRVPALWRYSGIVLCLYISALTMIRSFNSSIAISAGIIALSSLKKKTLINALLLIMILGVAFRLMYGTAVYARLFAENDESWLARVESVQLAINLCNTESPLWGGNLENVAVNEVGATVAMDERSSILSSADHCGAFFLRFGWCGVISWLLLLWLPPLLIWEKRRHSPFMLPLLLCCFVYLPISSSCSNVLLRPHCFVVYALLYFCTLKIDSGSPDRQQIIKTNAAAVYKEIA